MADIEETSLLFARWVLTPHLEMLRVLLQERYGIDMDQMLEHSSK